MYNGIRKIEDVINFIEENILNDISCDELAAKMNLSVYEFRRIFAFIVGCPISEYIRKRRLSLAACEILKGEDIDMRAISEKYGYATQSAFIKAFGEQHGVSPTAYLKGKTDINLFTRPRFEMSVFGRENIPFEIKKSKPFYISGFSGVSVITDTCCCENVWSAFYESKTDEKLDGNEIFVAYKNKGSNVLCYIGQAAENEIEGLESLPVAATKYACFKLNTVDDDLVNQKYSEILYEWLPSANLKINNLLPIIEVYPKDMSKDGFEWEIRIPIE
jgi:AraC family transcriptional regulator